MKKIIIFSIAALAIIVSTAFAKDTYIKGYYKKNGTYVQPYSRSAPDRYKYNNYGTSSRNSNPYFSYEKLNPYIRDKDRDSLPNYIDMDDNNNGTLDDLEHKKDKKLFKLKK